MNNRAILAKVTAMSLSVSWYFSTLITQLNARTTNIDDQDLTCVNCNLFVKD